MRLILPRALAVSSSNRQFSIPIFSLQGKFSLTRAKRFFSELFCRARKIISFAGWNYQMKNTYHSPRFINPVIQGQLYYSSSNYSHSLPKKEKT